MTFADLRQKLKSGEVSANEIVQDKISRIKELDQTLNTFLTVNAEQALSKAKHIDNLRLCCNMKQIRSSDRHMLQTLCQWIHIAQLELKIAHKDHKE